MAKYVPDLPMLVDDDTGAFVGVVGADGKECLLPQFARDGSGNVTGLNWPLSAHASEHAAMTGRTITGAADAALSDNGMLITANSASALALTIPNDATVAWSGNAILSMYQAGAGTASFTAGSGVTLRSPSGVSDGVRYGIVAAMRVGANEWTLL